MKNLLLARIEQIRNLINYLRYKKQLKYNVMDIESTLKHIKENHVSMGRYGDGELGLCWGNNIGFQKTDKELVRRLLEILKTNRDDFIVGLPDVFNRMSLYHLKSQL